MTTCIGLMTMYTQSELQGKTYVISVLMQGLRPDRKHIQIKSQQRFETVLDIWHSMDTACIMALSLRMDTTIMIDAQQTQSPYRYCTACTKALMTAAQH